MRKKNWLIWLLAILLMAAIFSFSAQNANTSGTLSKKVTLQIIDTLPQTRELSELQKVDMVRETENIVRKSAHFVLFAVLAVCITLVMGTFMKKKWLIYLAAVAFCFLYACSDELHQLFVDGSVLCPLWFLCLFSWRFLRCFRSVAWLYPGFGVALCVFRVKFNIVGKPAEWISGKDVILHIIGMIGVDAAEARHKRYQKRAQRYCGH